MATVTWIGDFHPAFKMERELLEEKSGTVKVVVGYHDQLFPGGNPATVGWRSVRSQTWSADSSTSHASRVRWPWSPGPSCW